jgi:predicted amidohydrolase YtcJ
LKESADLIITGAKIFTSDNQKPWAESLAIKDGKFVYVGDAKLFREWSMGIRILDMSMSKISVK